MNTPYDPIMSDSYEASSSAASSGRNKYLKYKTKYLNKKKYLLKIQMK